MYDERNLLLMTPGPVPIHPRVYEAMNRVICHHRTENFRKIFMECIELSKYVMQTENDVFILTGSGTAAMEAAIANVVEPGDDVICFINGKFSERWFEICQAFGAKCHTYSVDWGKAITPDIVKKAVDEHPEASIATICHNETSTGVLNPLPEIAKICRENDLIIIVDGITSVGGDYVFPDKWGVNVLVTGSQKCLGCPPGLSLIMVDELAWEKIKKRKSHKFSYYVDLERYKKSLEKNRETPYTPAITLLFGLKESLTMIKEEGLEQRVKRHRLCGKALREGVKALGFQLFEDENYASNTLTAVSYPEGVTDSQFRGLMEKHGVLVAGGQAHLKGKIFRVAHMNIIGEREILTTLAIMELVLSEIGWDFELGSGVSTAIKIFKNKL